MTRKPTFGCGVFLPGEGPGNFPEFTGGGTIDSGGGSTGGGNPDPPIPIDPADPIDPIDPDKACACVPDDISDPGENVIFPPGTVGIAVVVRTYSQKCQEFPSETEAFAAVVNARNILDNQAPPPLLGTAGEGWVLIQGPEFNNIEALGKDCKLANGECGGFCPDITVATRWRRGGLDPAPPAPVPGGPGGGAGGGITPGPGGVAPPPGGPSTTPTGPGGGITPGGSAGAAPPPVVPPSTGGDLPTTPPPVPISEDGPPGSAGGGLVSESTFDERSLTQSITTQDINLNDPAVISEILKLKPNGIEDQTIAFNTNPQTPRLIENDTEFTEIFNKNIDSNIHYVLKNRNNPRNWDSTKAAGVTTTTVLSSLKPEIRRILGDIRNYDGTKLTRNQIFSMIGSRILDGSIGEITQRFLQKLADDSQRRVPTTITRSSIDKVNEVAALILIDKNKIPLDTSKLIGREGQIFKNFKILSSDVDKFLPVTIDGVSRRFYINDDDTFIGRETLSIKDGDYFDVISGGTTTRLFARSEKDHAFLIPEDIRQRAITLLGGEPGRTLSVSGDKETASGIEYDSSLSSPRQPFYVLSAVLSSLQTSPSLGGSFLLKDTTVRYQLMDTSSAAGLDATNEFIKYKANKRVFVLDHEDLIIDYIENTQSLNLTQTDILFNSPKVNKTIPLLVRQIPFYIMVYPTNRSEYNIFNDKSTVLEITTDGSITRELRCRTHINPEFTQAQTNKFIRYGTVGTDAVDVFGTSDPQTRISFIDSSDSIFKSGFRKDDKLVPPSEYGIDRSKTGFRLLREIINELDTNYELSINGVGKTLTEFDAFSRLNLKQFNILSRLENFNEISKAIANGLINEVKLIPPIENSDNRIVVNKTQLVQRKTTAGVDSFKPIKATNDGRSIVSPNEKGVGGFGPVS
jgi:hypothetical protein